MRSGVSFKARSTTAILACFVAASLVAVARAGDKSPLNGHWNYNQDQSDDAQQRVAEAQQDSKNRADRNGGSYPGGGGQYPNGGGYPGGGIGRVGVGGMGGIWGPGGGMGRPGHQSGSNRAGVSSQEWDRLAQDPKYLRIDQRSDQVVVIDDNDVSQTFYPDGKKHDEKDSSGKKVSTKADWDSGVLTAETNLGHSERLTQTFRVSSDGKQLFVTTRFEAPSLAGPLSIRRVYDRGKAQAE